MKPALGPLPVATDRRCQANGDSTLILATVVRDCGAGGVRDYQPGLRALAGAWRNSRQQACCRDHQKQAPTFASASSLGRAHGVCLQAPPEADRPIGALSLKQLSVGTVNTLDERYITGHLHEMAYKLP